MIPVKWKYFTDSKRSRYFEEEKIDTLHFSSSTSLPQDH